MPVSSYKHTHLFKNTRKNQYRKRRKPKKNEYCGDRAALHDYGETSLTVQSRRLKSALDAMAKMQAEGDHGRDVDKRDGKFPETQDHHHKHIRTAHRIQMTACRNPGVRHLKSKMQKMIADKRNDQKPCPDHVSSGEGCRDVFIRRIGLRFSGPVLKGQHSAVKDMETKHRKENQAEDPDQDGKTVKRLGIGIHAVWTRV